jgi:hypothetical protein
MESAVELITLVAAGVFAGGALYVSLAEHPGRVEAGVEVALSQFEGSYRRAAPWQGATAAVSLIAGVVATVLSGDWQWAVGGALVGAAIPVTLLAIMPVNRRLHGLARAGGCAGDDAAALLARWGRLHSVRSALGVLGFAVVAVRAVLG